MLSLLNKIKVVERRHCKRKGKKKQFFIRNSEVKESLIAKQPTPFKKYVCIRNPKK